MGRQMRAGCLAVTLTVVGLSAGGCKSSSASSTDGGDAGGLPADCPQGNDLISNFEQDNSLAPVEGRSGGWYTYGDSDGMFLTGGTAGYDIAYTMGNPHCTPGGALHIKGTGFAMWGAATGVDWRPRPSDGDGGYGDKMTYDASAYTGIAFWAKASAPLDGIQVSFPDLYTDGAAPSHDMPDPSGNPNAPPYCLASDGTCRCIYNASSYYNCSPYLVQFGLKGDAAADTLFSAYANYQIGTDWQRFQVLFADTHQDPGNGGYHTPANMLTVNQLTGMAIQINPDYSSGHAVARDFELWIDDVGFIQ